MPCTRRLGCRVHDPGHHSMGWPPNTQPHCAHSCACTRHTQPCTRTTPTCAPAPASPCNEALSVGAVALTFAALASRQRRGATQRVRHGAAPTNRMCQVNGVERTPAHRMGAAMITDPGMGMRGWPRHGGNPGGHDLSGNLTAQPATERSHRRQARQQHTKRLQGRGAQQSIAREKMCHEPRDAMTSHAAPPGRE